MTRIEKQNATLTANKGKIFDHMASDLEPEEKACLWSRIMAPRTSTLALQWRLKALRISGWN